MPLQAGLIVRADLKSPVACGTRVGMLGALILVITLLPGIGGGILLEEIPGAPTLDCRQEA